MIKKFKQLLKTVVSKSEKPIKPIEDEKIQCAVDENIIDCEEMNATVPAPTILEKDPWFGEPVLSEKNQDYMEKESKMKAQEEKKREEAGGEPENIHQLMYEIATNSGSTTLQLDPIGGSENVHR